jgi:hypothetical protein
MWLLFRWEDIRNEAHPDANKEGWIPLTGRASLVKIAVTIAWVASAHHAAVNFGQYDYSAWMPSHSPLVTKPAPARGSKEWQVRFGEGRRRGRWVGRGGREGVAEDGIRGGVGEGHVGSGWTLSITCHPSALWLWCTGVSRRQGVRFGEGRGGRKEDGWKVRRRGGRGRDVGESTRGVCVAKERNWELRGRKTRDQEKWGEKDGEGSRGKSRGK